MTSGSRLQVVWPAPDLQVDFCYAVALDQRAEVVDQAEVCRRKVNIELPALRPTSSSPTEHLGPAAAEAAERWN
jgi:hypothetical protein